MGQATIKVVVYVVVDERLFKAVKNFILEEEFFVQVLRSLALTIIVYSRFNQ